ncbi:CpaF family protein [Adlercreutzia sp. ZJ473]|uniref:CpaF family protein n=1 Tax=Adlercreutzia sp. ZJ473 TaxID=2722822 RepID=UPI001556F3CB|nr:CpaF family protein [Adlercreutzia sp. ZJ473]
MTLAERVRSAEGANATRGRDASPRRRGVEDLRRDVKRRVPLENIAVIMASNPERARNELRTACRGALAEPQWADLTGAQKSRLADELIDVVFGMGPLEGLIDDESVTEIMVNGSRSVYFERDGKLERSPVRFESDEQVRVLIDRIIGPLGRRIDEASPMVDARLAQGHRVNAVIPPVSPDGPVLTIRAFSRRVMMLEEMERRGSLDAGLRVFLGWLVRARKNVVVSGGTGSGKTTLLNALSCLIPHEERVITIEDSAELKFEQHPHVVRLEARPRNAEGEGEVTIRDLVVNALRMRPDRIIVGECRSGEAIDMLQAMLTGHEGSLTTLHANSPEDVVDRMVTMVRYAVDLPVDAIEAQIGGAFDYVVQVARAPDGSRFLSQVAEVGFDRERRRCVVERVYVRDALGDAGAGSWLRRPACLDEVVERRVATREEVDAWERRAFGR